MREQTDQAVLGSVLFPSSDCELVSRYSYVSSSYKTRNIKVFRVMFIYGIIGMHLY